MKKTLFSFIILLIWEQMSFAQTKLVHQTFDGFINNKIPISLTLIFDGNLLYGTLVYTKVGQPIKVIGTIDKNDILIHEFATKADITGVYYGTKKGDEISGSWSSPNGKEMKFFVKSIGITPIDKPEIKLVTGTYAYNFGKVGGTGSLYVQQVNKDKIVVEMQSVKGPPSYNQAIIEKTSLKLVRNEAIYENNEFGKCKLKISFFDEGANIVYLNEAYDCGFGNAASVVGNYMKFDSKAPKFEKQ
jgi:hypothetical protein